MRLIMESIEAILPTRGNNVRLIVECNMTGDQMLEAMKTFSSYVSGETWLNWLEILGSDDL